MGWTRISKKIFDLHRAFFRLPKKENAAERDISIEVIEYFNKPGDSQIQRLGGALIFKSEFDV